MGTSKVEGSRSTSIPTSHRRVRSTIRCSISGNLAKRPPSGQLQTKSQNDNLQMYDSSMRIAAMITISRWIEDRSTTLAYNIILLQHYDKNACSL